MGRKLCLFASATILFLNSFLSFNTYCSSKTTELQEKIEQLIKNKKANFGIAVKFNDKNICNINGNEKFPLMSVFKLHQAAYILYNESNNINDTLFISNDMLNKQTYSPLRDKHPNGNFNISIKDIIEYSVCKSDNNASNILFSLYGGSKPVHEYIATLGCNNTQIKWTEDDMHSEIYRCYENYTTPNDAIILLEKIANEKVNKNILWLNEIIGKVKTGENRLAKPLIKTNTSIHHKTGTGFIKSDGTITAINDIGYVKLANGNLYYIAVLCSDSKLTSKETEDIIAEISSLTYQYIYLSDK